MLKFLLVILCIYFLFRIFLRSFRINMTGQRFDMGGRRPDSDEQGNRPSGDRIHVEDAAKKQDESEYSDYEEIK
jgi:hypothetical protein